MPAILISITSANLRQVPQMPLKSEEKKLFFTLLIVLIASALVLQYLLVNKPAETYSEAYFVTPTPEIVSLNQEFPVTFVVANHENAEAEYTYHVYFNNLLQAEGALFLSSDESRTVEEKISSGAEAGMKKVEVRVTASTTNKNNENKSSIKNYEIHFWVEVV